MIKQTALKKIRFDIDLSDETSTFETIFISLHNRKIKQNKADVETLNTAFNTEACILIKSIEAFARYTSSYDKLSANHYRKQKEADTKTPTIDHITHCNGCGKQHKPPCRLEYKAEYNHEN